MQDHLSKETVEHIAALAKLTLTPAQVDTIGSQLSAVLEFMSKIQELKTDGVPETAQVTGLENVFHEDVALDDRMFSQEQALANARRTHDGFFVVGAVLKEF